MNDTHKGLPDRKHLRRIAVTIPWDQTVIYFVTLCCAGRRQLFSSSEAVQIGLSSLMVIAEKFEWRVLHICFMPDHVHLFVSPQREREQSLSGFIKAWKSSSTQRFHKHGIADAIWQREFFDHLLRSGESLEEKWNYVRMNPVRAGLCAGPDDYLYLGTPESILERISGD